MAPSQTKKKSGGRRKIDMKLIEDEGSRRITLSKRRGGLFKKATELTTLCGAQVAMIVYSLGGKAHAFGHPSVESVADQFFNGKPPPDPKSYVHRGTELQELKEECDQISKQIKAEKKRGKELEEALENSPVQISAESLCKMNLGELEQQKQLMEDLQKKLQEMIIRSDLKSMEKTDSENVGSGDGVVGGRETSPIPPDWLKL